MSLVIVNVAKLLNKNKLDNRFRNAVYRPVLKVGHDGIMSCETQKLKKVYPFVELRGARWKVGGKSRQPLSWSYEGWLYLFL